MRYSSLTLLFVAGFPRAAVVGGLALTACWLRQQQFIECYFESRGNLPQLCQMQKVFAALRSPVMVSMNAKPTGDLVLCQPAGLS